MYQSCRTLSPCSPSRNVHSFPPKNAKIQYDSSNNAQPVVPFYPTSVLAQSEIWDENVRNALRKPRFKKKDIDERKSAMLIYQMLNIRCIRMIRKSGRRTSRKQNGKFT